MNRGGIRQSESSMGNLDVHVSGYWSTLRIHRALSEVTMATMNICRRGPKLASRLFLLRTRDC